MALTFDPIAIEELEALDAVLGPALHFPGSTMLDFMRDMIGTEHMRAVRRDGHIVAGLGAIAMGQWFGGRCVPCAGVTAVGVAPDARGEGVGAWMLRRSLEELRISGIPLAALYPATLTFYRGAGYERAGNRFTYELPLSLIDQRSGDLELALVPFGPEGYAEARRLFELRAKRSAGNLERPEWLWNFRMEPPDKKTFRFFATRGDQVEGYIVYTQAGRSDPITISDLVILTPAAGRRFLALLAAYGSVIDLVVWGGGALDPLAHALGENLTAGTKSRVGIRTSYDWMLRIVDIERALTARGYPPGLRTQIDINVIDETLPDNAGRYTIALDGGRAEITRGGSGAITIGVRELAALYTGFAAPYELRTLGRIDGDDGDLALLGAIFSGPRPWMTDMF